MITADHNSWRGPWWLQLIIATIAMLFVLFIVHGAILDFRDWRRRKHKKRRR